MYASYPEDEENEAEAHLEEVEAKSGPKGKYVIYINDVIEVPRTRRKKCGGEAAEQRKMIDREEMEELGAMIFDLKKKSISFLVDFFQNLSLSFNYSVLFPARDLNQSIFAEMGYLPVNKSFPAFRVKGIGGSLPFLSR